MSASRVELAHPVPRMSRRLLNVVAAASALAILTSCGAPQPAAPQEEAPPVASSAPERLAPTTAPAGPCTWSLESDEPAGEPVPTPTGTVSGDTPDVAPHQAENDQWRQRRDVTTVQVADGLAVAEKVRPVLVAACEQGDFSPERLAAGLAVAESWTVFTIQPRSATGDTSTGVEIALEHSGTCLVGDTRPGSVTLRVTGPIADGGCWEPPSS